MNHGADSDAPRLEALRLLFIHHSCGGQLLADPGLDRSQDKCIYDSHPNGGGLRTRLQKQGYEVHEASYGSEIGEKTDLFDWLPKFQDNMDRILALDRNDRSYGDSRTNQIVVWKSCFPNNLFLEEGVPPGDPKGPDLTVWNARATLSAVLQVLARHPEVLFVYVTAPPIAGAGHEERSWKWIARKLLGRGRTVAPTAALARAFNSWAVSPEGWLKGYPHRNVVVFDYYGTLTDDGASDFSRYPTGGGSDSHPSDAGNARAAERFVLALDRAVRRAREGKGSLHDGA